MPKINESLRMLSKAFKTQLTPMENNCCKCPSTTKEVCGYLDSTGKFFYTQSEASDSDIAEKIFDEMWKKDGYSGYTPSRAEIKKIIDRYVALKPLYD